MPADDPPVLPPHPDPGDPDGSDPVATPVPGIPPRTWRRTAWLSVGASCLVLTVLLFAAARLAERPLDRIDAFPGLPTGGLLTARSNGPSSEPAATTTAEVATLLEQPSTVAGGGPLESGQPSVGTTADTSAGPAGVTAEQPSGTSASGLSAPASLPGAGSPVASAADLASATERFYELLPGDLDAAWAMVGPPVRGRGYDNFRRQWGDLSEVTLQQVVVDAESSSVLATVRLVTAQGGELVKGYRLSFSGGSSLIIDDITQIAGAGQAPVR